MPGKTRHSSLDSLLFCILFVFSYGAAQTSFSLDSLVVRAILDSNGLTSIPVDSVAFSDSGKRITSFFSPRTTQFKVLPADIGKLTGLKVLTFAYSGVETLPKEIRFLSDLMYLMGYGSNIRQISQEIGNLVNLIDINFGTCKLTTLPAEIGMLVKLESIYMDGNAITGVPNSIGNLTSLRFLALNNNQISALPASIGSLCSLRVLGVINNKLSELPAQIGMLNSLKVLEISNNAIDSLPKEIRSLKLDTPAQECVWGYGFYSCQTMYSLLLDSNRLCAVDDSLRQWINVYAEPRWDKAQKCSAAISNLYQGKNFSSSQDGGMLTEAIQNARQFGVFNVMGRRIGSQNRNSYPAGIYLIRQAGKQQVARICAGISRK